jgi:hypothetical protein
MNDEKLIENRPETGTTSAVGNEQRALLGKIARLPHKIREQLNRRIRNGEPGPEILTWVNKQPAVKKVLAAHFGGTEINDRNLSAWRHGGYERWLTKQELLAEVRGTAEDAEEWSQAAGAARGTARMAVVRLFQVMESIPPERRSTADLVKISQAMAQLLKVEQNGEWLEHDKKRVELSNEHLTLRWDIHQRDVVRVAFRVLDDEVAKKIHRSPYTNEEKFEMMGHCLYGHLWQGREVGKRKDDAPPPPKTKPC